MNNFELHSRSHELADSSNAYSLARKLIVAEEELADLRQSQQAQVEAVGYVLPTGMKSLKKDHPATIYAPDNAMVPGSCPIWLYDSQPAPAEAPKGKNRYGLDARYFHQQLGMILRDIDNYTPNGMMRALAKLALIASPVPSDQKEP